MVVGWSDRFHVNIMFYVRYTSICDFWLMCIKSCMVSQVVFIQRAEYFWFICTSNSDLPCDSLKWPKAFRKSYIHGHFVFTEIRGKFNDCQIVFFLQAVLINSTMGPKIAFLAMYAVSEAWNVKPEKGSQVQRFLKRSIVSQLCRNSSGIIQAYNSQTLIRRGWIGYETCSDTDWSASSSGGTVYRYFIQNQTS